MQFNKYGRKRIKYSDKSLIFRSSASTFTVIFVILLIAFNIKKIIQINWKSISLFSSKDLLLLTRFNISKIILAASICAVVIFIYFYRHDRLKRFIHRQKLARMILENKWYESKVIKDYGFFKDLNVNKQKEKIVYFPKIYYELKDGLIYIQVEITL